jgi:hypothetical protein
VQLDVLHAQVLVVGQLQPRATPPSWSSEETRISSPAASSRPAVRESVKFSDVMFGPKMTSVGSQPRNAAAFASASATIAATRWLVS